MKTFIASLCFYLAGLVTTYGHAYNTAPKEELVPGVMAFVSAIFWPLYWSKELWK